MPYNPNVEGQVEKDICVEYENSAISTIEKFLGIQKTLGVAPPICIMISLLETKGCQVTKRTQPQYADRVLGSFLLKEETLLPPEVIFESFEIHVSQAIRPIFDIVLNAAGVSRTDIEG